MIEMTWQQGKERGKGFSIPGRGRSSKGVLAAGAALTNSHSSHRSALARQPLVHFLTGIADFTDSCNIPGESRKLLRQEIH